MARYIDADALIRVLNAKADIAMGTPKEVFFSVAKMVDYLPATDVVSKSEGDWAYEYTGNCLDGTDASLDYKCSLCGNFATDPFNYCPHCGASMKGGAE